MFYSIHSTDFPILLLKACDGNEKPHLHLIPSLILHNGQKNIIDVEWSEEQLEVMV